MTLIGRSEETRGLERAWERVQQGDPQLVVMWGRRRVGKTFLLSHFAVGKRAVYFTATRQDSERRQVDRYTSAISEQLGEGVADPVGGGFVDWEAALRFTLRIAADRPLLVVLDEAPRLLAGRRDFADLLTAVWESRSPGTRLLLAVSGFAVSVMEQMLGLPATAAGLGSPAGPSSASTTPWSGCVERVTSAPYARSERR